MREFGFDAELQQREDPNGDVVIELFDLLRAGELLDPFEEARGDVEILESLIRSGIGKRHPRFFDDILAKAEKSVHRSRSSKLHQRLSEIIAKRTLWCQAERAAAG